MSCKKLGRRYIGFDITANCLDQAVIRLRQNVLPLEWKTEMIPLGAE